jgi:chaperone modulatory protein CbpM
MSDALEAVWLSDADLCSSDYLIEASGLSARELAELIDSGVLSPFAGGVGPAQFSVTCVRTVRIARRLRDDFELDHHGLALALVLLRRIEALEGALREVRAGAPARQAELK